MQNEDEEDAQMGCMGRMDDEDFSEDRYREKLLKEDAEIGIFWMDESPIASEREGNEL